MEMNNSDIAQLNKQIQKRIDKYGYNLCHYTSMNTFISMLNSREMAYRLNMAKAEGTPIVNYGVLIAHIHGILKRSLSPFKNLSAMLEE